VQVKDLKTNRTSRGSIGMRPFVKVLFVVLSLAVFCGLIVHHWWQQPGPGTTSVQLTGRPGDSFTGFYIQGGRRVEVRGVVPWKVAEIGISEAEFRQSRADETLQLEARHFQRHGFDARVSGPLKPEFAGMRVRVHHSGIGMEPIR
jgi:hypothetical protein